jgi:hypothetical protein
MGDLAIAHQCIYLYYKHLGLGRRPDTPGDFKTIPVLPEDKIKNMVLPFPL